MDDDTDGDSPSSSSESLDGTPRRSIGSVNSNDTARATETSEEEEENGAMNEGGQIKTTTTMNAPAPASALPSTGMFDVKALKERAWESERNGMTGMSRAQRVESSWEDVSSDDDDDNDVPHVLENGREGDGWEDESSSEEEEEDSDSGDSNATASGVRERGGARTGSNNATSSAKEALREYRQSKRALMLSESNNMEKYTRLMRGEQYQEPNLLQGSDKEMKRTDTAELLHDMEPFSAGRGTEAVDEADPVGRAHEFHLEEEEEQKTPSRRASQQQVQSQSHSRKGSSNASSRSPFLDVRGGGTSRSPTVTQQVHPVLVNDDNDNGKGENFTSRGRNGFIKEVYASEPATPDGQERQEEWIDSSPRPSRSNHLNVPSLSKFGSAISMAVGMATGIPSNTKDAEDRQQHVLASNSIPPSTPMTKADVRRGSAANSKTLSSQLDQLADAAPPLSLWDYLKEEVMATDFDSTQELKWERVTNFIAIPFWMEKIMIFGFAVCLDSFLYTFTILPLRSLVALYMWIRNNLVWMAGGQKRYLHSSHKCDMLKALLIVLSCYILSRITDASKMYHSVRGQDVVKLYVIFNVLEIADRLCCSFGQDLLDSLFSRLTLARRKDGRQPYLRPIGFFLLSLGYVLAHTLVLFYQLVTLNVAINSYDNALLTLLLSNQFVEIKGSVFKKFEKENLFQLTCADIVERFQLTLMLSAIGLRNLIEVAGAANNSAGSNKSSMTSASSNFGVNSSDSMDSSKGGAFGFTSSSITASGILGPLPTSFTVFPSFSLLETTFTPVCIVLASECLVDWLKHAFITKFNHIRPSVYGRFMDVLCRDLTAAGGTISFRKRHTFVDQSPVVSRRLGFAAIPLACLLVRISSQIMGMLKDDSHFDECSMPDIHNQTDNQVQNVLSIIWNLLRSLLVFTLNGFVAGAEAKVDLALDYIVSASAWILTIFIAWIFLVAVKLLLGTNLVSYASHRYSTMDQREREEELNARDRPPIGVDKDEKAYEAKVSLLIDKREDDASRIGLNGQPIHPTIHKKEKRATGNTGSLMDVDRYSMIRSRIW